MDISYLASAVSASVKHTNTAAAPASSASASGSAVPAIPSGEAKPILASNLRKAISALQGNLAQNSSIDLQAGLDPNGGHPGQVLVKLSDKVTKQVFFQYYAPPEQIVKSAQGSAGGAALPPGSVVSSKA